jgi:UDP-2,3-diacylglucosamine pyrophosphatase LpxH
MTLKEVVAKLKVIAKELDVHPSQVTVVQAGKSGLSERQLKNYGGLPVIKKAYFPYTDKDLASIVQLKKDGSYVQKLETALGVKTLTEAKLLSTLEQAVKSVKPTRVKIKKVTKHKGKRNMTMELMLSDLHYGKKSDTFDLVIARQRMTELIAVMKREIAENQKLFNVEKLIVALIGDIIESYTMHGLESSMSSEFSNSVQVKEAIESLFYDAIVPLAELGIPIDIPAVTGNHDRHDPYRTMFNPGETNLTWIIYNALDLLIKQSNLKHVKMNIPKDSFCIVNIYGNNCLIEHGDQFKSTAKAVIEKHMQARSTQLGLIIDFFRFGHWHEYLCYGRGRMICNESLTGQDSYAKVMGFNSQAGQTINYYIETDERPNCFYKSFPVYLK